MAEHADREAEVAGCGTISKAEQQAPVAPRAGPLSQDEADEILARHFAATRYS